MIPEPRSILVIRRNRLGDMICTLPLLHALRKRFPHTLLQVLCESGGEPIAKACSSVNQVSPFRTWVPRWAWGLGHRDCIQGHDLVIVAKGGFDRALAKLARSSGAPTRIGFEMESNYYTHSLPEPPYEHQLKTLARLLLPLGIEEVPDDFSIQLPKAAEVNAEKLWTTEKLESFRQVLLLNLTCNRGQYWPQEHYVKLIQALIQSSKTAVLVLQGIEDETASPLVNQVRDPACRLVAFPNILDLAAFLKRCHGMLTPEGGIAHLAATVGTRTVVLWKPDGVIQKWGSKGAGHFDFQPENGLDSVSVETMLNVLNSHFA